VSGSRSRRICIKRHTGAAAGHAIRDVYKGGKYLSTQVLESWSKTSAHALRDQRSSAHVNTHPREREIRRLLAEGNSVKEICGAVGLSVKTIEAHKFN